MHPVKRLFNGLTTLLLAGLFCIQTTSAQNLPGIVDMRDAGLQTGSPEEVAAAESSLLGRHMFSLQWISWERFGTATIHRGSNGLEINAYQSLNGDFVKLDGLIEVIDQRHFYFTGNVSTRVYHINNGQPCERSGTFLFQAKDSRQYWRMQPIQNPCDNAADYIDIFFKR
ncbi:hypothetical protein [Eikenella corrodens]|uniref:hypothetical protein n=1 Tax=Eikenella corrodens TaxID=539 RepID=UPI00129B2C1A|nr:hypothetical protein [Eikenella corrodens]MDU1345464.1 hypothetical protein [Eikenella corrodens]